MTGLGIRLCLAAALVSTAGVASLPAMAQSNVLERWFGPPKGEQRTVRRPKPKRQAGPEVPPIAAVPVPDVRPTQPGEVAPSGTALATSEPDAEAPVSEPAAGPVSPSTEPAETGAADAAKGGASGGAETPDPSKPLPEPRPETPAAAEASPAAADAPGDAPEPAETEADKPAAIPAGSPDDAPGAPKAEPGTAEAPADPRATAEKPVYEIPVPEKRPAEPSPAESAAPPPAATPDAKPAAPEPEPEDAPNSTDRLKARVPTISPAESVLAAAAIEDAENCEAELTRRGVEFTVGESISEGECGVLRPVNVTVLASGVKVSPKTQMLCRTALALDDWMTTSVVPAAKADLPAQRLTEFRHASTYVCRPRASERGISEHARGSAIDIAAFVFNEGKEIGIAAQAAGTPEAKFQDAVRTAACGPFKTVLGPGTDADHATHFHLDIAARRNGSTYCK